MNKKEFEQLKGLLVDHGIITKKDPCVHFWRLDIIGDNYVWYCQKCRKTEPFEDIENEPSIEKMDTAKKTPR